MNARITLNLFGFRVATIDVELNFDLDTAASASRGHLVKGISRLWMKGMVS